MRRSGGFILLAVVLTMSLVAVLAYMLNRENGTQANRDRSIADTDRARYAAEAGLLAVNARIQSRDCNNFPTSVNPLTNDTFFGARYSAYSMVSGSVGAPIILVSIGRYDPTNVYDPTKFDQTVVRLVRSNTYAYKNSTQGYQLQPTEVTGTDTYLAPNSTFNYGGSDVMPILGANALLIKFDLTTITFPVGTIPDTATLQLRSEGGSNITNANAYRMNSDWIEGTGNSVPIDGANWFTSDSSTPWPTFSFHPVVVNTKNQGASQNINLDVTQVAHAWMSNRYPNYGFRINLNGNGNLVMSENANNSRRPTLNFQYWQPCGTNWPG